MARNQKARQNRYKYFVDKRLPVLCLNYDIREVEFTDSFMILDTKFGILQYFPKSDKLQFHSNNRWMNNGWGFINNNLNVKL